MGDIPREKVFLIYTQADAERLNTWLEKGYSVEKLVACTQVSNSYANHSFVAVHIKRIDL